MEYVIMILIAFGIVGSIDARVRVILKAHEHRLDSVYEELDRCNRKLDLLLHQHEQSSKPPKE
jgi:hypothetical protein